MGANEESKGWTNALVVHTADDPIIQRTHTKYQLESHLQPVMMSSVTGGCPLALVILLLVSMDPTATEVVRSVSNCPTFSRGGTPPEIPGVLVQGNIQDQNRYKPICQTYKNKRRFMTLYDTRDKIPVFSAYKYKGHTGSRVDPKIKNGWGSHSLKMHKVQ
ncbi:unnamed protein product [Boreogadus saida]